MSFWRFGTTQIQSITLKFTTGPICGAYHRKFNILQTIQSAASLYILSNAAIIAVNNG